MEALCSDLGTMRTHRPGPQPKSLRAAGQNSADASGFVPYAGHTELLLGSIQAVAIRSEFWEHRVNVRMGKTQGGKGSQLERLLGSNQSREGAQEETDK